MFANALRVGVGEGEADVVGERADVGGVVVEAFQFDEQRAQPVHLVRHVDAEGVLDGQAVRQCVRDGRVTADPLGEVDTLGRRPAFEELLHAAVDEPQPGLEP